jgi:hypothetical protein
LIYSIFKQVLLSVNYAHAKGVLHHDIKSKNILVQLPEGGEPRVRLIDFGIATDLGTVAKESRMIFGTPAYIPPERWRSKIYQYGPWTDLYSCGVLLWDLICGTRPFGYNDVVTMMEAHLFQPLPPFCPRMACPAGIEEFLSRMMEKKVSRRYVSARRALYDWQEIFSKEDFLDPSNVQPSIESDETMLISLPSNVEISIEESHQMESSQFLSKDTISEKFKQLPVHFNTSESDLDPPIEELKERVSVPLSPLISEIQLLDPLLLQTDTSSFQETLTGLSNYGVNLLGFRDTPLFGREQEQNQVLEILSTLPTSKVILLHVQGAKGVGTSRFARWISEFLVENLSAIAFRCAGDRQLDPVAQLLRSQLRGTTMDSIVDTCSRYKSSLLALEIQQLQSWLLNDNDQFTGNHQKYSLALRLIEDLSRYRDEQNLPVVFVDHANPSILSFLQFILAEAREPMVVVLTCYPETDEQRLSKLQQYSGYHKINLSPMNALGHKEILQYLVHCDETMLRSIIGVSSGNPKISRQIIEDAILKDQLEVSDDGLRIKEGVTLRYRRENKKYWKQLLNRMISENPAELQVLKLASILGFSFLRSEWEQGITALGIDKNTHAQWVFNRNLILITENEIECRFVNPVFYKVIRDYLSASADYRDLNTLSLRLIQDKRSKKVNWRRGQYYVNLGQVEEGIQHLIQSLYQPPNSFSSLSRKKGKIQDLIEKHNISTNSLCYVQFQRFLSNRAKTEGDIEGFLKYNQWLLANTALPKFVYERGLAMHDAIITMKIFGLESKSQTLQRIREAVEFSKKYDNPRLREIILRSQFDMGELSFESRRKTISNAQDLLKDYGEELSPRAEWYWARSASFLALEEEDFETILELAKFQHQVGKKNKNIDQLFSAYLHYCFYYIYTWQSERAVPWINRAEYFLPSMNPHHQINLLQVQLDQAYYSGNFQQATSFYHSAIEACEKINRTYIIPFLKLIQIKNYIQLREFDAAAQFFLEVVDYSEHQAVTASFELARLAVELGHKNFASVVCTNIIQRFPMDKNPHFYQKTLQLRETHQLPVRQVFPNTPLRVIRSLFND